MIVIVLMMKWEWRAALYRVVSLRATIAKPMYEPRYVAMKTSPRTMSRNLGRILSKGRVQAMVSRRLVMMSPRKTIERRGGIPDVSNGKLAGGAMVALRLE